MAATPALMFASWFGSLALGGVLTGLPLGVPPLPEDPAMSRIAPDECLWYFASAGMATPDPTSENQTEQLLAEPELQELAQTIESQIRRAIRQNAHDRGERILSEELPKLVKTALIRPLAVYISEIRPPGPDSPPTGRAGLVVSLGDRSESTARSLGRLERFAFGGDLPEPTRDGDIAWHRVPAPQNIPAIQWAIVDDYLIVGVGEGEATAIVERKNGSGNSPEWLDRIRSDLGTDRVSTIGYIHVAGIVQTFGPLLGEKQAILTKLGLSNVEAIYSASGLDDRACVSRAKVVIDGQPKGVFALLPQDPLSKRDIGRIPQDAVAAVAVRFDADETLDRILDLVDSFDPDARDEFEEELREFESAISVDIREDLLRAVDDVWIAYLPGGDLFTSWIGATAVVKIKDRDRLEGGIEKFVDRARMELRDRSDRGAVIRKTRFGDQTIHFISIPDDDMPFAPAWTITDDYLVVGLMPQTIKAFLARTNRDESDDSLYRDESDDSLYDVQAVADALSTGSGAACVTYFDMERLVRGLYPLLQIGARMVCVELRREGIDVDVSILPSVDAIARHMGPAVSTWSRVDDGFLAESRQPLPGGGNVVGAAPVAIAVLAPALHSARSAARESQDINHLKNLALAFHNYTDVHKSFPKNIYDEDGKPLLSWRVQLLPYLEEAALYDEFHLDESWDSEHNRKLIERMSPLFSSPNGPAQPGKTRFVAFVGEGTIFPGDEKLDFRHVSDGTSHTLMIVRAAPQTAIPWTKPDDITFDPKKPKKGLDSPQGHFLAAFVDGHVRRLSLGIPDETMRSLIQRADGEAFDYDDLDMPPRR